MKYFLRMRNGMWHYFLRIWIKKIKKAHTEKVKKKKIIIECEKKNIQSLKFV